MHRPFNLLFTGLLLQTSLLRALAPTTPTYIFPAMNTLMYEHPLTNEHLRVVKDVIGYTVVGPIGKTLACGDVGTFLTSGPIPFSNLPCYRTWRYDRMARHNPTRRG